MLLQPVSLQKKKQDEGFPTQLSGKTDPNISLILFPQRKDGRMMEMFSRSDLVLFPHSKREVCFQTPTGFP